MKPVTKFSAAIATYKSKYQSVTRTLNSMYSK